MFGPGAWTPLQRSGVPLKRYDYLKSTTEMDGGQGPPIMQCCATIKQKVRAHAMLHMQL